MADTKRINLPSLEDILEKAEEEKRRLEEKAMKVTEEVAKNLEGQMLLDTKGLLQKDGTVFVILENYFQESRNGTMPTEEVKERSMQIVVEKLKSDGFNASYNRPKPEDVNDNGWSINISKK